MNDPITDHISQLLNESEHVLVPLEELHEQLTHEGLMAWMTLELLEQLLSDDERFEVYEGLADSELFNPVVQAELQSRGLLSGPLVMLRERASSTEEVMLDMLLHLQEMNKALETAWQLRPANNPEVDAEILNLLMMGDMLEREIRRALETGSIVVELGSHEEVKRDLGQG